jgi:hypothetical protein
VQAQKLELFESTFLGPADIRGKCTALCGVGHDRCRPFVVLPYSPSRTFVTLGTVSLGLIL